MWSTSTISAGETKAYSLTRWAGRLPTLVVLILALFGAGTPLQANLPEPTEATNLWSLKPLVRPTIPPGATGNPIDAFIAQAHGEKGLKPFPAATRATWLRRVSLDLTGLLPSQDEVMAFLADTDEHASARVVDRLLESPQHGVRYGRHWLDLLRFSDLDEHMPAAEGLHYWRDWVITALNDDLPYDEFVRAQLTGNRAAKRRTVSAAGHLTPVEPRPEDLFASGFLSRGAATRDDADQQLAMSAVETVSMAFMGMTVGCARCHSHFYDPISQTEYYSMKALFDPLVLRPVALATPDQVFAHGKAVDAHEKKLNALVEQMRAFLAPYHRRLYEERLSALPAEAQAAIRKPEKARSREEQKVADDYFPILRIDPPKYKAIMPAEDVKKYDAFLKGIADLKPPEPLPGFMSVMEDSRRLSETNYVLTTGDAKRPKLNRPVSPGFPFAPPNLEFREGRRETFGDWLTAPENPLFARVAVHRIWQWHFGLGLHHESGDFGTLGGKPAHPALLDWLATEFIAHGYSMKWLHKTIVLSEAYQRSSSGPKELEEANARIDPDNRLFWKYSLRRLEAEPIRDVMLQAAGTLDLRVGGKSFEYGKEQSQRRTAYMSRGYRSFAEVMPDFLQTFDAEDGRNVCSRRNQTVTAPQALWLMNGELTELASTALGERLERVGNPASAIDLAYCATLGRPATDRERALASRYLAEGGYKGLAWILFNLDEFVYVP